MKKWALYGSIFFFSLVSGFSAIAQIDEEYSNERKDMFYKEVHASKKRPVPLVTPREADVVWEKLIWRSINLKERFNQFFYYPLDVEVDAQGRTNLVNAIWKGISEGRITVYEDDEFKNPIAFDRLEERYNKIDTIWYDDYDPETDDYLGQKPVITKQDFNTIAKDFYKINLKEWWFIDKAYTIQDVRIVGLSLERDVYRTNDLGEREYRGNQPLGWIRMQDPAVRELLAQTQAYNEHNDAAMLSYDQIFLKRYFESVITRESNVQNRPIDRAYTGLDALLEAERIKEEIFNKELDLWEY